MSSWKRQGGLTSSRGWPAVGEEEQRVHMLQVGKLQDRDTFCVLCSLPVRAFRVKVSARLSAPGTVILTLRGLGTSARCVSPTVPLYTPLTWRMSRYTRVPRYALVTVARRRWSEGKQVVVNTAGSSLPSVIFTSPSCRTKI